MSEKNKKGTEYITPAELDKQFDEKLGEQAKVIISAVDTIVNKRLAESELRLGRKIDEIDSRLGEKIDKVQTQLDGYVKKQEDFKEEFVIVKEEGKQMKQVFKEKLGVKISAV